MLADSYYATSYKYRWKSRITKLSRVQKLNFALAVVDRALPNWQQQLPLKTSVLKNLDKFWLACETSFLPIGPSILKTEELLANAEYGEEHGIILAITTTLLVPAMARGVHVRALTDRPLDDIVASIPLSIYNACETREENLLGGNQSPIPHGLLSLYSPRVWAELTYFEKVLETMESTGPGGILTRQEAHQIDREVGVFAAPDPQVVAWVENAMIKDRLTDNSKILKFRPLIESFYQEKQSDIRNSVGLEALELGMS